MNLGRMFLRAASLVAIMSFFTGCATQHSTSPQDPYEGFNRTVFSFNQTVDSNVLKPVAQAYQKVTPTPLQTGIGNFFGNLGDLWSCANNLMQGKAAEGAEDFSRVMINSFIGVFGIFDVATEAGIPKHNEDFGQTLGRWGVGSGPYLVLPFIGPSTVRDTVALPADYLADPWGYVYPVHTRNAGYAVRIVHRRASLLDGEKLVDGAALDRYQFMRDAYLQRRKNLVNDNKGEENLPVYDEDIFDAPGQPSGKQR